MEHTQDGEERAREAVRAELSARQVNTSAFAREAGVDTGTVSDFLAGRRWPFRRSQARIEAALGWEPGSIERIAAGRGSVAVMCPDDDPPEQDSAPVTRTVHLTVTDPDTAGTVNVTVTVTAEQAASMDWSAVVMSAIASLREQRERRSPP